MDERYDENIHFKMRLDQEDIEEPDIPTQVDELRIEKLSHRITFIGILIPVLIVIILTMAYLDIKHRVTQTEDSGAVTAKNLTQNIDSRFSTLSLNIEETLAKFQDETIQSIAKAQVNINKLDDRLKQYYNTTVSQKELKSASQKIDQEIANVANATEEIKVQMDSLSQALQPQMAKMEQDLATLGSRMVELKKLLSNLKRDKIDKAALDLAIKLEILKIKQQFNVQLEEMQNQVKSMNQKISKQVRSAKQQPTPASPKTKTKKPAASQPNDPLQEQNIH